MSKPHAYAVLVNNAAAFVFGTIDETSAESWDKVLSVNVKGYALCAKHAVRHMAANPPLAGGAKSGPALVHIASISSFVAQREFVPYNTSKGAIVQLSRCLAFDLGQRAIRSNTVCPGTIETPATHKHAAHLGVSWDTMVASVLKEQFVQRLGQPDDVAAAVAFLASDEAGFISGADLVVDGGYLAR